MHLLSKSTFLKGNQCLKALYLYKKNPELMDEVGPDRQAVFDTGHDMGELARGLFPGGVDVNDRPAHDPEIAVERTREQIEAGKKVIYEAAFQYGDVFAAVDILAHKKDGWHACEVKSSTSVNDVHSWDCALQYYVITGSGTNLKDISVIHINTAYTRKDELELKKLFKKVSLKSEVLKLQEQVKKKISVMRNSLSADTVPEAELGPHCLQPYECTFRGHCWQEVPDYSVFNISSLSINEKFRLYRSGISRITEVPDDFPLSASQRLQIDCERNGKPAVNSDKINNFLSSLSYPLYYLDFESISPALPLYPGSRPYMHIVFQYSLHYQESADSELKHYEHISGPLPDPRPGLIEQLIKDCGSKGDILVYHQGFEIPRLKEMAKYFPEYKDDIKKIISRIKDLIIPFKNKYYYSPEMKGSYSIKKVLPALVPGFDYSGLAIADGGEANRSFQRLVTEKDQSVIQKTHQDLLVYCKQDTLAMVKILEKLRAV